MYLFRFLLNCLSYPIRPVLGLGYDRVVDETKVFNELPLVGLSSNRRKLTINQKTNPLNKFHWWGMIWKRQNRVTCLLGINTCWNSETLILRGLTQWRLSSGSWNAQPEGPDWWLFPFWWFRNSGLFQGYFADSLNRGKNKELRGLCGMF